jgi:nicotinamide-nucleotide amidase
MEALTDIAASFIEEAKRRRLTFVTAESCTAGGLSMLLSDTPGAGETFFGGFVSYSKDYKRMILGVPAELLALETAVSDPVARAMAQGALGRSGCDLALAITGVAGPKPDEDGNPVGLVFVAAELRSGKANSAVYRLGEETSGKICGAAMREALTLGLSLVRG